MRIIVSIDDTDNIYSRGTGELAEILAEILEGKGWGKSQPITRHQLYIHPDIPYTSHNSAMCFEAEITPLYLEVFTCLAGEFLEKESASGSDPGLCIVVPDNLKNVQELIDYGYRAKEDIITKEEAYTLAARLNIHLSEHGGTGDGIIGAMAGAGLRMTANDGRFRGQLKLSSHNGVLSVGEIKRQGIIETVRSLEGHMLLDDDEQIRLGEKIKGVMLNGQCTLLVFPTSREGSPHWETCNKRQLKIY